MSLFLPFHHRTVKTFSWIRIGSQPNFWKPDIIDMLAYNVIKSYHFLLSDSLPKSYIR